MKKFVKKYLSGVMVLFLLFCIAACGSTAGKKSVSTFKTQELFSKYSKDKGIHMGISMKNNGTDISVDIYQLGEKMYLDATSGEDRFLYIVKDDIIFCPGEQDSGVSKNTPPEFNSEGVLLHTLFTIVLLYAPTQSMPEAYQ